MFRLTLNSGYTASQERITVISRGLPVVALIQRLFIQKPCKAAFTMATCLRAIF